MKVSLICTVLNEEDNIRDLLISFKNQSVQPDEVIIVDGGSTDRTYEILKEFKKEYPILKVMQVKCNIAEGRNIAIKKSSGDIIIVADAGARYHKDWIKNLLKGFNGEVCFGRDVPLANTDFEKELGKKLCHKRKAGSSRNMIFARKVWEDVGGYPEDLLLGEDTIFEEKIKRKGYKICYIDDAICYWIMRKNIYEVYKQFFNYGYWDGIALKTYKILPYKHLFTILILYMLLPLIPIFILLYFLSTSWKIEITRRFGYFLGFHKGLLLGSTGEANVNRNTNKQR